MNPGELFRLLRLSVYLKSMGSTVQLPPISGAGSFIYGMYHILRERKQVTSATRSSGSGHSGLPHTEIVTPASLCALECMTGRPLRSTQHSVTFLIPVTGLTNQLSDEVCLYDGEDSSHEQ
ncbi:hypothetical protein E2C01_048003 [Portunus trituberculatus]|uniref:Uncharacterized protein n=1 Tax=Portunus trituberculatus TaxID=210409 RepID=A0A5B7G9D2_PORTR|nr:hypothetical protein [Portunus trituberculatus]